MRGNGVNVEHQRPGPPRTWQPTNDRLSAERAPDTTDVGANASPTKRPERFVVPTLTPPLEGDTRNSDGNVRSSYQVLRSHGNQLLDSTKRSLILAKQSAHQKFAARAASSKAAQRARELANLRAALLLFSPSDQAEQTRLGAADEVRRKSEETRRHAESGPAESERRSPDKSLISLYQVLRSHGNQLLDSTKRSLIFAKQSAQQKFAARAVSRQAAQRARELANLRAALLIFSPSEQAEQTRLPYEDEVGRQAEEARRHAEAQARIKAEQERHQAQAEQARLQAEEEIKLRAEEARRHAEAQARIKAEQERQQAQAEQRRLQAEEESLKDSENKHCPKCKRIFGSDQAYCLYDAARLVSATDAPVSPALKLNATTRPVVWFPVIITFLGTGILGLLVINYIGTEPSSFSSEEIKQFANVKQDQPVVGGTLKDKETILPNPDYPERAKRERASGAVTVAVLVDKNGTVRSARALNGHPLLQAPAVAAARKAKFAPEKLDRQGPRTSGTITYNFRL